MGRYFCYLFLMFNLILSSANAKDIELDLYFEDRVHKNSLPVVIVEVSGKKIPLVLDTGYVNGTIALTRHALTHGIYVEYTGVDPCSYSMTGKDCRREIFIPEVKVGDQIFNNVKGEYLEEIWGLHEGRVFQSDLVKTGVLGLEFLRKFGVLFDYQKNQIVLTNNNAKPSGYDMSSWITIPFTNNLVTTLTLNGKKMKFLWDTGCAGGYSVVNKKKVKHQPLEHCKRISQVDGKPCMTFTATPSYRSQKLSAISFITLDLPKQFPFDGLICSDFFLKNRVFIDFAAKQLLISPEKN